jgi:hypothetical protein
VPRDVIMPPDTDEDAPSALAGKRKASRSTSAGEVDQDPSLHPSGALPQRPSVDEPPAARLLGALHQRAQTGAPPPSSRPRATARTVQAVPPTRMMRAILDADEVQRRLYNGTLNKDYLRQRPDGRFDYDEPEAFRARARAKGAGAGGKCQTDQLYGGGEGGRRARQCGLHGLAAARRPHAVGAGGLCPAV